MAEAPAVNGTLTEADAPQILEELLPAQLLGVKLGLPDRDVEAIILRYPDARDRLYHIIIEFLRQVEPRPTWRVIVEALRSPTVGLPDLAKKLEEVHFPDSISTSDVVAEPKDTESGANYDEVKSKIIFSTTQTCTW